jgi:hypothetical protein
MTSNPPNHDQGVHLSHARAGKQKRSSSRTGRHFTDRAQP